jgi:hypothetical protein
MLLALGFDQLQYAQLLFDNLVRRYRQPETLRRQEPETPHRQGSCPTPSAPNTRTSATEDAVGAILLTPTKGRLIQDRPDQETNARLFPPIAGPCYSGSSSASIANFAITSEIAVA